jgi:hypothetical protein
LIEADFIERRKPIWLPYYSLYVWAAVLLSIVTVYKYAGELGTVNGPGMIARLGLFSYAAYSLRHWHTSRVRKFHMTINALVAFLGFVLMTPLATLVADISYFILPAVSVPIFVIIPDDSQFATSASLVTAIRLILIAIAAYWFVCWHRFVPSHEDETARQESNERSRSFQKKVRIGIIATMLIGIASVAKALVDGANQTGPWAFVGFVSLVGGLVAMMITQWFARDSLGAEEMVELLDDAPDGANWSSGMSGTNLYGQTPTPTQEVAADPLADSDLNPDEIRHLKAMRKKAKRQKADILNKDVTGIAFLLIGIPVLLVIAFAAFMITVVDGGGVGTFLGIFLLLGLIAAGKIIKG